MHAVAHCIPHRGPSATRARARWQPYSSVSSTLNAPSRTPPSLQYLPTPASSECSSPPPSQILGICSSDSVKTTHTSHACQVGSPLRDAQKTRYVNGLVDQAIRSLCDTWRPDIVPSTFIHNYPPGGAEDKPLTTLDRSDCHDKLPNLISYASQSHLPSPISPNTRPTTFPRSPTNDLGITPNNHVAPIRSFVHEVLRRSRTSVGVLQTALCYLEAVRRRVPDVIQKEREGTSGYVDGDDAAKHVTVGVPVDQPSQLVHTLQTELLDTVRMVDGVDISVTKIPSPCGSCKGDSSPAMEGVSPSSIAKETAALPSLPPQPSPLLCPRRTFLGCLILATKFMQDRSYSNRAWAKLAGLSPREIGRCERAVGNALEWRLWVGKDLNAGMNTVKSRALARTRSDGSAFVDTATQIPNTLPYPTPPATPQSLRDGMELTTGATGILPAATPSILQSARVSGLRRYATVPSIVAEPTAHHDGFAMQSLPSAFVEEPTSYIEPDVRQTFSGFVDTQEVNSTSPQWSTPPLTYSPMSTSSTSSDGSDDRTIQILPLAEFPSASSVDGYSAGCTEHWRSGDIGEVSACAKPSVFDLPGSEFNAAYAHASLTGVTYHAPGDFGPLRLPPISVGFPSCDL